MSDPRDDLAALINGRPLPPPGGTIGSMYERMEALQRADAILAAGWTKPKPPTVYPDHDIETYRVPICGICGKDVEWDDDTESWTH